MNQTANRVSSFSGNKKMESLGALQTSSNTLFRKQFRFPPCTALPHITFLNRRNPFPYRDWDRVTSSRRRSLWVVTGISAPEMRYFFFIFSFSYPRFSCTRAIEFRYLSNLICSACFCDIFDVRKT